MAMIRVKLMSIMVNDQNRARRFYTDVLGFSIKHDIPIGEAAWLTLVAPDDPKGVELLLEPTGHPAAVALQQGLNKDGIPLAQLYTEDIAADFERLSAKGVAFRSKPKNMGPTKFVDFDDTCGNLIRLVEG
jgi:catechol 2,3-dioxygenase-like lactoylglutathione lyase family enzyme